MLVGRVSERQSVDRILSAARLGRGGVLLIAGDPGVGKTTLLAAAVEEPGDMAVLRATGRESEREVPFGGLSQLLRPALDLLDTLPLPQAEALGAALALRPGRSSDRFAVGAATLSLLCRYAEARPVAVVVDDLHLWDGPSAEALTFAAHRLTLDPVAVLVTARTAELTGAPAELPTMELGGLDVAAAAALISGRAPHRVPDELVERLHRATAGNPLALLELTDDLQNLERSSPQSPVRVPAALAAAFTGRLSRLDSRAQKVLIVLAAADGELGLARAACQTLGLDLADMLPGEAIGLISVHADRVQFRHPLVRSAIYAFAAPRVRREVHGALADALPKQDTDRRAWHLAESLIGPDSAVAGLLDRAAVSATDRSAYAAASAAYERAAAVSPLPGDRATRLLGAAETAWRAGMPGRALGLLTDREEIPPPTAGPGDGARALSLRATIAQRTGTPRLALPLWMAAAEQVDDPDDSALLLAEAVYACYYLGDITGAVGLADRLDALGDRVTTPRARARAGAAAGAARMLANASGQDQLRTAVKDLQALPPTDDERHLQWLLTGLLFLRDTGSQAAAHRLVDRVRAQGSIGALSFMLFLLGRDEATSDRWPRAEATYTEAVVLARECGNLTDLAMALSALAWLTARQGRETETLALIGEAETLMIEHRIPMAEVWSLSGRGELEMALGRTSAALSCQRRLDGVLRTLAIGDPDLSPAPDLIENLLRLGHADEARAAADSYARRARDKGLPWVMARAERALGLCAEEDRFDGHYAAALEAHALTPDRYEEARTRLAYGARLRRARRRVDSRDHLRAALEVFESLPSEPWADRAATELTATGEHVRRREQPQAAALTPQELQISLLLVEGRTTREVAAALFLSPKTVEYHLRKVYTKLGVRSRGELADMLPR